jgi:hypothetical protein
MKIPAISPQAGEARWQNRATDQLFCTGGLLQARVVWGEGQGHTCHFYVALEIILNKALMLDTVVIALYHVKHEHLSFEHQGMDFRQ